MAGWNCDAICNCIEDFHFSVVYGVLFLLCVFVYICINYIFGVYVGCVFIFGILFFCIADVAHLECGYIVNLLYSHVEFNFQD